MKCNISKNWTLLAAWAAILTATHGAIAQEPAGPVPPPAPATAPAADSGKSPVSLISPAELVEKYGLPSITEGPRITLAEALKAADAHNPTLAAMKVNIEAAQARVKASWGAVLPVIQGKMGYTVRDHADTVNFGDSLAGVLPPEMMPETDDLVVMNRQDLNGSLAATMPVFNFQSWVNIRVAKDAVELSRLDVEASRRQVFLNVAESYVSAMVAQKLIEAQLATLGSFVQHLSVAEARFAAGAGLRIDVIRAETDVETAKQQIINANLFFDSKRDALSMLTGIEGLPIPAEEPVLSEPEGDREALVEQALSARPDMRVTEASIAMNRRALRASRAQFAPTIDATWQGSYQFTDTGDLGSSDKSRMTALFSLTVPIYNHFRYGDLDQKKAELLQSRLNREDVTSRVSLAIRQAERNYASALSSAKIAERQAALSKEALSLTQAAYNGGAGSSLEVTDAMRTMLQADLDLATKNLEAQTALLRLLYELGEDMAKVGK